MQPPDHPVPLSVIRVQTRRLRVLREVADRAIAFALDETGSTTPQHLRAVRGCAHALIRGHVYSEYLPTRELDKIVEAAVNDAIAGLK